MKQILRNPNLINHSIKIISLVLGYSFWAIFAQNQNITISTDIPIYFYGNCENLEIISPEAIQAYLLGKRLEFGDTDCSKLAAHINLSDITKEGDYNINICDNDILLQNKIKLVSYSPTSIKITVKEKKKNGQ